VSAQTLARVDTATAQVCAYCGAPLADDGPGDTFCREACQILWHRRRADTVHVEDAMASLRELFEQMVAALAEAVEQWGHVIAQLGEQLRGLYPDFVIVEERDQRERALWLRRHRNTGRAAPGAALHRCAVDHARLDPAADTAPADTTTPLTSDKPGPGASGNC
jgi:hypothetical protein